MLMVALWLGPVEAAAGGVGGELGDGPLNHPGTGAAAPVGQQVVQHLAADNADQVDAGLGDYPGGVDQLVAGGAQGDGEAAPVGIDIRGKLRALPPAVAGGAGMGRAAGDRRLRCQEPGRLRATAAR